MRRPFKAPIVVGVLVLLAVATPAFSQYLADAQANLPSGGFRHSSSFMSNYYIYRSIGGETYLKGKEQERQWWCVWLCKRNVDGGLLPIDGVISHHIINVDGGHFEDWTAKGKHPAPPVIIL